MSFHLLIDGDVLHYSAAFAAQRTHYRLGNVLHESADACKEACKAEGLDYKALRADGSITTEVDVLPEGMCVNILSQKIGAITNACMTGSYTLYMTGSNNFRKDVAKTKEYKGNRKDTAKPIHYEFVKHLLLERKNTVVAEGQEADDEIAIAASANPSSTIVCSIDKDLLQLAGRHYNWDKQEKTRVTPAEGFRNVCLQVLTGDTTDNIPGLPAMGPARAATMLSGLSPVAMVGRIVEAYAKQPKGYLEEQLQLVWLRRYPGQMIALPEFRKYAEKANG